MLKNILVHIPSERSIRPITDSAISLATRHAAHLDAVSIGFETANLGLSIDAAAAVATIYEVEHEGALARANAALAVFETEARNAGISMISCRLRAARPISRRPWARWPGSTT